MVLDIFVKRLEERGSVFDTSRALSETIWAICSILKAAPAEVSPEHELACIPYHLGLKDVERMKIQVCLYLHP